MPTVRPGRFACAALLAALAPLLGACGGDAQSRPSVVSVFPADGQVVGWLGAIRVTYDEPVEVLSDTAAAVAADAVEDGGVAVKIFEDPNDPNSILIIPDFGFHFFPNQEHHLVVEQGAVVNADDHYARDEFDSFFTVGAAPNLFLTTTTGNVYEVNRASGAQVSSTAPPPGTFAHDPVGTDGRVWVWLDGAGDGQLGTFVPGAATVATTVPLSGEVGARTGSHLALDPAGTTLYATARDAGTSRLRLHRIDVATLTETGSIELSPPLAGAEPDFQPAIDRELERLYVPFSDGAGGGFLAVVDLETFVELDVGPDPGVDALPMPDGAGDAAYDSSREVIYVILEDETTPGFVLIGPEDFAQFPAREPTLLGAPEAIFPTPDGRWLVQGVSGYVAAEMRGLIRTEADEIGDGFSQVVSDDVGVGPEGSTRVGVLLRDPADTRFFAFADDGASTVLASFDFDPDFSLPIQVDFDVVTPGVQSLDLSASAPGVVTGATTLFGATGP